MRRPRRWAFELLDDEPWLLISGAPSPPPVLGPTVLDVDEVTKGNRLSVTPTRNGLEVALAGKGNILDPAARTEGNTLDSVDTRNILDLE